ncbi:carbohydrate-binding protein [Persicobacter psychrovividus]|uniref:Carbohydrate-binding protein n=1 Tax=Persicobacter psychrovividus TaxID=387638 RepID=A0ABM7VMV6_9BACT|nr:hypothetical protein PEPS_45970 [Persicobacter psychrovividus]
MTQTTTKITLTFLIALLFSVSYAQPPGSGWGNPVFEDDFYGNALDQSKWRVKDNGGNGDGEGQFKGYMVNVANGILTINNDLLSNSTAGRRGGWVDSKIKFGDGGAFPKYGYFEADIRINLQGINFPWQGGKIWPTWWLWEGGQGSYIPTEFDIMEYSRWTNFKANNNATSSHHYRNKAAIGSGPDPKKFAVTDKNSPRDEFNWHKWGLLWMPNQVVFYYDGQPYGWSDRPDDASKESVPLKLIFSSSPHVVTHPDTPPLYAPNVSDILPSFQVRSVRVWQGGNPAGNSGGGTGTVVNVPGTLEGENYKAISNGVQVVTAPNNKKALGYIQNNAWSEHYINIPTGGGTYAVDIYASSGGSGGTIDFTINGHSKGTFQIPKTANWDDYKKVATGNVTIDGGTKTIRLVYKGTGSYLFNIDGLVFRNTSGARFSSLINEPQADANIRLFPNPTSNEVTLEGLSAESNIQILDLNGIILLNTIAKTYQETIDISHLMPGIYLVKVNGVKPIKLVKN